MGKDKNKVIIPISKEKKAVYHDLDHLAGTWDEKDLAEFQKNTEEFERIDKKMD